MSRTGVFICHCGTNIAGALDIESVAAAAGEMPGVVYAADYKYLCSEPGQQIIKDAIKEHKLDRIVISSCSPRMHEATFRKMLGSTDINPYMLEIANIREQCSWVHTDNEKATEKAIALTRMSVFKVSRNEKLYTSTIPINKKALVIGGGIAGIQAALDIADAGHEVVLVENEPSIGGKMVMLDKTFPTLDCSACISTPKMVDVGQHPNITLMTSCDVEKVEGYIGNFEVTIYRRARFVNHDICTGCGLCETKCPVKIDSGFDQGMGKRSAIYKLFPQAVPAKPVIDPSSCLYTTKSKCGLCKKVCPLDCIDFEDEGKLVTDTFGAIIIATGYRLIDWQSIYYEYAHHPDIITGLQFERLVNASGPTEGHIIKPSDKTEPKTIVIIKCVGSRDPSSGKSYCSRACCMYAAKHAHQILEKIPDAKCFVFYIDVRTPGKGYEEFYDQTRKDGAIYVRGRVSKIFEEYGKLICLGEDTLTGRNVRVEADMVVVETAMEPSDGIEKLAGTLGIARDSDNWLQEAHPKLKPVETQTGGIFLAGVCQGPKDIPDTVAQASAAAAKVIGLLNKSEMEISPMIACVDSDSCSGCSQCAQVCSYQAISITETTPPVANVNPGLCLGCGTCTVVCRTGAIDLLGFSNGQILKEVDALCQ